MLCVQSVLQGVPGVWLGGLCSVCTRCIYMAERGVVELFMEPIMLLLGALKVLLASSASFCLYSYAHPQNIE